MSEITFYTVDLAKRVFQVHGFTGHARRVSARRLSRARFMRFFECEAVAGVPVIMEACATSHYWGRWLAARGYQPVLLPAHRVRAMSPGNKTDAVDADALALAWCCGRVKAVAVKSEAQQTLQFLHRLRERRVRTRTAVINQLRALLRERGSVAARGSAALRRVLAEQLDPVAGLDPTTRRIAEELREEWRTLDAGIQRIETELRACYRDDEACQRLGEIPGIGLITATALVAAIADPQVFRRGRSMAVWLGLTPREHSSGDTRRLGPITKRGDTELRRLLIHGARAVVTRAATRDDATGRWIQRLVARRGHNRAVVALANKNARIAWALLAHGTRYRAVS